MTSTSLTSATGNERLLGREEGRQRLRLMEKHQARGHQDGQRRQTEERVQENLRVLRDHGASAVRYPP
jgi:hypothetical protein